jgi:hypothetical protein
MPESGHNPRWKYDCERCKFHWCCGPTCYCGLRDLPRTPPERMREVRNAERRWKRKRAKRKALEARAMQWVARSRS